MKYFGEKSAMLHHTQLKQKNVHCVLEKSRDYEVIKRYAK